MPAASLAVARSQVMLLTYFLQSALPYNPTLPVLSSISSTCLPPSHISCIQ